MSRLRAVLTAVILLAALATAPLAVASSHFNPSDVFREVRCPTCGTSLDVSNAPVARRMKQFVLVRWRQGWSKERVIDALAAEFGEDVRTTPPKSGFGLVAWLIPAIAVLVGLVVFVVMSRRWVWRRRTAADEEPAALDAADAARLERELERFGDG